MIRLVITGVGAVRPGPADAEPSGTGSPCPLPPRPAHQVDLDLVALLGRKTVRFNHRSTLLAMVACDEALRDSRLEAADPSRERIGITIGTTAGGLTGMVHFGMDTFTQPRPYLVDATSFPNSVINTTAGALAIRTGMRGANSTVASGPLAVVSALRHAQMSLRASHVDTVLVGAVEEYTGPTAWWAAACRDTGPQGEGAAMFVLERPEVAAAAGRPPLATLASAVLRSVDAASAEATAAVVSTALLAAGVSPGDVRRVVLRRTGVPEVDAAQRAALARIVRVEPEEDEEQTGDCHSAHGALQLARLVGEWRTGEHPGPGAALLLASDPTGAVGVAVLQGPPIERKSA
jgi:3-oxoacyl-[acyl-carrier-protein] synthase II